MLARDRHPASASSAVILPFTRPAAQRLLDDCTGLDGRTRIGTQWHGVTDYVIGGDSIGGIKPDEIEGRRCLRLMGRVDTRAGGFVMMAMELLRNGRPFDAKGTAGLALDVFGNGEDYNIHLRTTDVRWYAQSYRATFHAPRRWSTVVLPWAAFVPHGVPPALPLDRLTRLGLLGWMRDFDVDLAVARVALI